MRLSIASALLGLGASLASALPNTGAGALSSRTLDTRATVCGGYTPASQIFDVGDGRKSIQDIADKNQTRILYVDECILAGSKYLISFVRLSDCQPITKVYGQPVVNNSETDLDYGATDPVHVDLDVNASAAFTCPHDRTNSVLYDYFYDVYFNGLHTADFLKNLGFQLIYVDAPF